MKLLRKSVGRPSNETLKKRRIFYIGTVIVLIATMVISGYLIINKFNGNLNSGNANIIPPKVRIVLPSQRIYKSSQDIPIMAYLEDVFGQKSQSNFLYSCDGGKTYKKSSYCKVTKTTTLNIKVKDRDKPSLNSSTKAKIIIDKSNPVIKEEFLSGKGCGKSTLDKKIYCGLGTVGRMTCTDNVGIKSFTVTVKLNGKKNTIFTQKDVVKNKKDNRIVKYVKNLNFAKSERNLGSDYKFMIEVRCVDVAGRVASWKSSSFNMYKSFVTGGLLTPMSFSQIGK